MRAASSTAQPSPAAAAQSSARAREAAAGNDVAHRVDVPNPRLGLESYQSLLKALMDGRGFDGLTDETYFTLASEAVRGRMMFALEQQRDEVIAVLKVWADKWAKLPYAHPSSLFLALWMRAEKQDPAKPIRSFRSFFEYAINDRLSEYSLPTAHHSMASGVESN